jgi:hypothetical protein
VKEKVDVAIPRPKKDSTKILSSEIQTEGLNVHVDNSPTRLKIHNYDDILLSKIEVDKDFLVDAMSNSNDNDFEFLKMPGNNIQKYFYRINLPNVLAGLTGVEFVRMAYDVKKGDKIVVIVNTTNELILSYLKDYGNTR